MISISILKNDLKILDLYCQHSSRPPQPGKNQDQQHEHISTINITNNLDLYCQHSSWPPQQGKPERSWTWLQRLLHVLQTFAISLEWFLDVLAFFLPSVWSDFRRVCVFFTNMFFLWRPVSLVYFRYTRCYDAFTSVCCSWQNKRYPIQKIQVSFVMNEFLAKCGIHQWDL